ncbi:NDR1/HIN1-like protein 6 [Cocos nucifera]|uniref:NDR1/HIN1-like protein 6 n=1 Tax=Cocos nucifera TaxID=13894 RepID=A0A8K0IPB6_COCNU|nr:NDR1/HIN1-like protein 6 [Cocos nucifera]
MGCFRRCLCCSCTLLLLFLLTAVASFLYLFLVINPVMPTYKVESFGVTALDINPKDGSVAAELAVTVRAENPSKKVGVRYKEGGWATVAYHGMGLCSGPLPAFYQEAQSVAVMSVSLKGREKLEAGMAAALQRDQNKGSVPLDVMVRAPVGLRVGEMDLREVVVKAVWDLEVGGLSPGKNASIKVEDYKVSLDL